MNHSDRPRKPTLADVAARASVDRSVVSRVLTGDSRLNIRASTRARVLQAVADLHYRPNAIARSLRQGRTGVLGLLIPDFANPVYAEIIKGAESAAGDLGVVLLTASACDDGFGARRYAELVTQGRLDGLVLAGASETEEIAASLARDGVPWLMLNRRPNRTRRSIILDDERAALLAVNHLLELGHSRIAHIGGPPEADSAIRRRAGYEKALRDARVEVDASLIRAADHGEEAGAKAMKRLLGSRARPTAMFAANVAQAIGALQAARRAGVEIPGDLSIVATHDFRPAAFLDPPLTTVKMPLEQLGRRAVELLANSLPDEDIDEVVGTPMELVLRESTGPPSRLRAPP
ncbi:MAG: LacI family DNA-binding transcriptional regulator [Actinomycetota bacterium]